MKRAAIFGLVLALQAIALEPLRLAPPLKVDRDDRDIPRPKEQQVSELYAIVYNSWARHLSLEKKALSSRDKGALNVNAWDEAPDSSWFNNRIGRRAMSFEEILAGLQGVPPQPGVWAVKRNVDEGYTPKFNVLDGAGREYVVKFDLPGGPERNSAAERICTLIMWAAGYNVPFNAITRFRREDLRKAEGAVFADAVGTKRPMTPDDLEAAFKKLKPQADGRYRGLASLLLSDSIGKFKYDGARSDDPNDIIPHQLRRELRGLRVIASWINHADAGDKNTIDLFVRTRGDSGYVKHFLLDFGSTLGSGDFTNGPFRVGHEYLFDGSAMARTLFSLGAWRRPWEDEPRIYYEEVGHFDASLFEAKKWKTNYPNLAFERMDDADGYWGAKIVTAFTDDLIRQLVEAGEYSRPVVSQYVADILKQRRDIIGRYWLDRVSPLEGFTLSGDRLSFHDLAVERGYAESGTRKYEFWPEDLAGRRLAAPQACAGKDCQVSLPSTGAAAPDRFGRIPMGRVKIRSNSRVGGWALPVELILGREGTASEVKVLGWRHAPR